MAYCGPKGIPLHDFLGWPEESQQAALLWQAHEGKRHSACGTHAEDWFDADGRPVEAQHWHEKVCPGCQRKQRAEEALDRDGTRGVFLAAADGPASRCPDCTT